MTRLICWNIFDGAPERWDVCADWLADKQPDIVALCECNGWSEATARDRLGAIGLPHARLLATRYGYHLCVASRWPVERIADLTDGFWHGALHVRSAAYDVIVIHLAPDPQRGTLRRQEAQLLLDHIADHPGKLLVVGDWNCRSSADADFYQACGMGDHAGPTAVDIFCQAGFRDLGAGREPRWSVPTPLVGGDYRLRFDYALAAEDVHGQALIVQDQDSGRASDHYPLIVDCE